MTGKREGIAVAFALEERKIAGFYASPLSRAVDTLLEAADRRAMDIQTVDELTDIDFGVWQGKGKDEIARDHTDEFRRWMETPEKMQFPGGESLDVVADRAAKAIGEIASGHAGENFVVCTHRVVAKALVCRLLGIDLSHFWQLKIDTGSITTLIQVRGKWVLESLNTDFHLLPLSEERVTDDF
jgi:broad specificity phosphatase PhoE